MALKPSRLRRINQRLTLAKYKIKSSTSSTLGSLVVGFIAKCKVKKSIMITERMINDQNRRYSLFSSAAASDSKLLNHYNQLVRYYVILDLIEYYMILFLFLSIFNAIVQSYSNNKY